MIHFFKGTKQPYNSRRTTEKLAFSLYRCAYLLRTCKWEKEKRNRAELKKEKDNETMAVDLSNHWKGELLGSRKLSC